MRITSAHARGYARVTRMRITSLPCVIRTIMLRYTVAFVASMLGFLVHVVHGYAAVFNSIVQLLKICACSYS